MKSTNNSLNSAIGWHAAAALFLLAVLIITKWPVFHLPYHWDEAVSYVLPAKNLSQNSLGTILFGFRPGLEFYGHPPLYYTTLAVVFKLFGCTVEVSHLCAWFWSFVGLFYTYLLGSYLFNRIAGILASLMLFFTPVFFAQSGMTLSEVPILALGVMSVYYLLKRRFILSILCGIVMVLTKEAALAIAMATAIYAVTVQRNSYDKKWVPYLYWLPVLVLFVFYVWQKKVTGQWVPNSYFTDHPMVFIDLQMIVAKGVFLAKWVLWKQYRLLWSFLILISLLIMGKQVWKKEYVLFGLIGLFFIGVFSIIHSSHRYILALLPYFTIAAAGAVISLIQIPWRQAVLGILVALSPVPAMNNFDEGYGNYDYDMQYTDIIAVHQQACQYLQQHHPDAKIAATWPMDIYLTEPWQGFVSAPFTIVQDPADCDFVVCEEDKLLAQYGKYQETMVLEKRFEYNHKHLELYRYGIDQSPNRPQHTDAERTDESTH